VAIVERDGLKRDEYVDETETVEQLKDVPLSGPTFG
jgi:hypothetical protein